MNKAKVDNSCTPEDLVINSLLKEFSNINFQIEQKIEKIKNDNAQALLNAYQDAVDNRVKKSF